jgi:hypothetical protein
MVVVVVVVVMVVCPGTTAESLSQFYFETRLGQCHHVLRTHMVASCSA